MKENPTHLRVLSFDSAVWLAVVEEDGGGGGEEGEAVESGFNGAWVSFDSVVWAAAEEDDPSDGGSGGGGVVEVEYLLNWLIFDVLSVLDI